MNKTAEFSVNGLTNEEVQEMIDASIKEYREATHPLFEEIRSANIENGGKLIYLQAQMSSLYGNGSGRKGAVERLDEKLDEVLAEVIENRGIEKGKKQVKKAYTTVLMWLGGGIGTAIITLLMRYFDHVSK